MEPLDVREELSALEAIYQESYEMLSDQPIVIHVSFQHGTLKFELDQKYPHVAPTITVVTETEYENFRVQI